MSPAMKHDEGHSAAVKRAITIAILQQPVLQCFVFMHAATHCALQNIEEGLIFDHLAPSTKLFIARSCDLSSIAS
jgi:hypothetical protein